MTLRTMNCLRNRKIVLTVFCLAFFLLIAAILTRGPAVSVLDKEQLRTYMLGRLSVTVPEFMQPQVEKFSYTWDSRTPRNKSYYLGYPITLQEQPYVNTAHAEAEWHDAVDTVRNENHCGLLFEGFEWDASSQFKVPAYFFCFKGDGATYQFYIIIQESQCLLHIVGRKSYRYPAQPEKDALTEEILQILTEFYKKYRQGHDIHRGNIFYTYYGEIIDVIFNTNERMSVQFSNTEKDLLWGINTSINFLTHEYVEKITVLSGFLLQHFLMRKNR